MRNDWRFHSPGGPIQREYLSPDHWNVGGVKIPFIERQPDSTEAGWTFRANDMQLNVPLKDELFEKTESPEIRAARY
jgi:hypothetical protein